MNNIRVPSGDWHLAATVSGDDPRIAFLHAGCVDRRSWQAVMAALAPELPAVAYDMRGFGDTQAAAAPFTNTDDLAAVLECCVNGPATLVGNSQGGRVAIDFALAHPSRVARLILIAPAVTGAPEVDWVTEIGQPLVDQIEAAENAGDLDAVNRLEALIWLDGRGGPEGRVGGDARQLFLAMNRIPLANESAPRPYDAPPAFGRLEDLAMPVLIIVGSLDLRHQRARSQTIAERVPNALLIELEGVAHIPQLERPADLAELIRDFLPDHDNVILGELPIVSDLDDDDADDGALYGP